jgi:hypothetical protein
MRKALLLSAAVLAIVAATAATIAPAQAGTRYQLQLDGFGTGSPSVGSVEVAGDIDGWPVRGAFTGSFSSDDGTLSEPGVCEPGTATLHIQVSAKRYVEFTATGDLCGEWADQTYIVTHVFTGRYQVSAQQHVHIPRKALEGFMEYRLGNDGSASVFLINT